MNFFITILKIEIISKMCQYIKIKNVQNYKKINKLQQKIVPK